MRRTSVARVFGGLGTVTRVGRGKCQQTYLGYSQSRTAVRDERAGIWAGTVEGGRATGWAATVDLAALGEGQDRAERHQVASLVVLVVVLVDGGAAAAGRVGLVRVVVCVVW